MPNPVHTSIADLEHAGKLAAVLTQNIDGLHHRGGTSPERLIEIHGTNAAIECLRCHARSDPDPHMRRFAEDRDKRALAAGGTAAQAERRQQGETSDQAVHRTARGVSAAGQDLQHPLRM